jgi:hypothetical protein
MHPGTLGLMCMILAAFAAPQTEDILIADFEAAPTRFLSVAPSNFIGCWVRTTAHLRSDSGVPNVRSTRDTSSRNDAFTTPNWFMGKLLKPKARAGESGCTR